MKNDPRAWPAEKLAEVSRLWLAGETATTIAKVFHTTRNAILGKVHRMGLSRAPATVRVIKSAASFVGRTRAVKPKAEPKRPRSDVNDGGVAAAARAARQRALDGRLEPAVIIDFPAFESEHAKPWTERAFGQCSWPIGEGADLHSCCAPVCVRKVNGELKSSPWCKAHHRIGFRPPKDSAEGYARSQRRYA